MKRITCLIALLLLSGCTTIRGSVEADSLAMPPDIAADCERIPELKPMAEIGTMGELYNYTMALIGQYGECALTNRSKRTWYDKQTKK